MKPLTLGDNHFVGSNEPTPLLHMEAGCPGNASYMKTPCTLSKVKLQAPLVVRASSNVELNSAELITDQENK